jgi:predicted TIM-barrel fold metal-dependent hydrolase
VTGAAIPVCRPPDPNPRRPQYRPPPKACDAHCHIFGPADKYPYAPNRSYTPPDAPLERFKALQALLGLERAVLVNASCHGRDNTVILDAIAQSEGRYRGVANVDGAVSDRELEALDAGGVRGMRFNFVKHLGGTPDLRVFRRLVDRAVPLGWHVVLHFDAADLVELAELLRSMPAPYIIDHMGRVPTRDGLEQEPFRRLLEMARDERCWVKICGAERISSAGPPFHDAVPFAQALLSVAPERILWGTDWPHPNIKKHMPNDGDLVDLIPRFMPDPALQRQVLVKNPERLYRFSG